MESLFGQFCIESAVCCVQRAMISGKSILPVEACVFGKDMMGFVKFAVPAILRAI